MAIHISTPIDDEASLYVTDGAGQHPDFLACPECSMPAATYGWDRMESTDGPVDHVRITCVNRHWFLMPADKIK